MKWPEDYLNEVSLWDLARGIPLPDESVDCVMTSPPYYSLRDYKIEPSVWGGKKDCEHRWITKSRKLHAGRGNNPEEGITGSMYSGMDIPDIKILDSFCSLCSAWRGCLGLEPSFEMYLENLLGIFDECKRVLKKSGTCFVNIGDSYASGGGLAVEQSAKRQSAINTGAYPDNAPLARYRKTNPKSMLCIPERFVIGMIKRGWILRNKICWAKQILFEDGLTLGSVMPSSVKDRFNQTWEPVYFFTKSPRYYFNLDAVRVKNTVTGVTDLRVPGILRQKMYAGSKYRGDLIRPSGSNLGGDYDGPKRLRSDYQGKFSGLEEAEKFNSPRARTQGKRAKGNIVGLANSNTRYGSELSEKYKDCEVQGHPNGKNPGSCWLIGTDPLAENHFAAYPEALCIKPILAGCPEGGIVCDPFAGRATTGIVALKARRQFIGFDLSPEYVELANKNLEPYKKQEVLKL